MVKIRSLIIIALFFLPLAAIKAQDNILDVTVSNSTPYTGELFTYSIKFTSSLDLNGAQIRPPQFVGFAQQPMQIVQTTETQNGVILNVLSQDIVLYGNRPGDLTIDATTIDIPDTPFQSGIEIDSSLVSVNVRTLPLNAPDTFSGAVGQFDMRVSLDPPIVQAGEPNLLRITITGTGNFDQIISPSLRFPATWDVFDRPASTVDTSPTLSTKTFEYQFFTDQTGNIEIPPVLFTYFDPLTATYKTITGEAGSVTVEGEFVTNAQSNQSFDLSTRLDLKPMTDKPQNLMPSSIFWVVWIIPPIIALVAVFMRFLARPSQPQVQQTSRKQSKSFKTVANQLTQARQQEPNHIARIVEHTIMQFVSEKYKKEITADELSATISNLPVNLQQRILVCLEQAQAGQYAPITPEDAEKLIRRTYKTLQLLEEERI